MFKIFIYFLLFTLIVAKYLAGIASKKKKQLIPISVNFHFTRLCNYECGFCFHTSKSKDKPSMADAKKALAKLADAGMRKINFAGGEPFLHWIYLGQLMKYCKEELKLESVSVVTNGSLVRREFFERYGSALDIMAVSCDSFDEMTNIRIGRGKGKHLEDVRRVAELCKEYGVRFKLNTVVCSLNWEEDMNREIAMLNPFRWKCFQVLVLGNENSGDGTIRDATEFRVTDEQFEAFISRHAQQSCIVPEPNRLMRNSYLLLDEHLRFLNCRDDSDSKKGKTASSKTLLEADVQTLLEEAGWDPDAFAERNGIYDWSKGSIPTENGLCGSSCATKDIGARKNLEW